MGSETQKNLRTLAFDTVAWGVLGSIALLLALGGFWVVDTAIHADPLEAHARVQRACLAEQGRTLREVREAGYYALVNEEYRSCYEALRPRHWPNYDSRFTAASLEPLEAWLRVRDQHELLP